MNRFYFLPVLIYILLASPLWARDTTDPYEPYRSENDRSEMPYDDSGDVPWKEGESDIPPLPDEDQLTELKIDSIKEFKVLLDLDSIQVGEDGVSRFWVVIKSSGGGFNAMYEGIRCVTGEYKTYAYGNRGRRAKVRPTKSPKWHPISRGDHRPELKSDFLCDGITPKTPEQVAASAKRTFWHHNWSTLKH